MKELNPRPRRKNCIVQDQCSFFCIVLDFAIRLLDLLAAAHESKPFGDQGIFIQREAGELVQSNPRFEMIINCCHSSREDACSARLLQLFLHNVIAPVCLSNVSLERIIIFLRVKVSARISDYLHTWSGLGAGLT